MQRSDAPVTQEEIAKCLKESIRVTRDDVVRAKQVLVKSTSERTEEICDEWLADQNAAVERNAGINGMSTNWRDEVAYHARSIGLRLAFYQALWELAAEGLLYPIAPPAEWQSNLLYSTPSYKCTLPVQINCWFPPRISHPPLPIGVTDDVDLFLTGDWCKSLDENIREAVNQSRTCFRRGLYMPAIAMLAAAIEAAWTVCCAAVGDKLADKKLHDAAADPFTSTAKRVAETVRALGTPGGKELLKKAASSLPNVTNAEVWTTTLRERRNALHWTKVGSFIINHADAACLLMMAPTHIATLEAIRVNALG